jgi:hypothetical protein
MREQTAPHVGDVVYVEDIDVTSGIWIRGGKAIVSDVWSSELPERFDFAVEEIPGATFGADTMDRQDQLASQYGEVVAGQLMMGAYEMPMPERKEPESS